MKPIRLMRVKTGGWRVYVGVECWWIEDDSKRRAIRLFHALRAAYSLGLGDMVGARVSPMFAAFVTAYDRWARSDEWCEGPMFDAMLSARSALGKGKTNE